MRHAGFLAAALLILACGPDPNAKLPFPAKVNGGAGGSGGATGKGGATSAGGSTTQPGSGGRTTPFDRGGATGAGGVTSSGGRTSTRVGSGGATSTGGATDEGGAGGTTRIGTGGRTTATGGRSGSGGSGGSTTTRRDGGEGGAGGRDGGADRPAGSGGVRGSGGAPGIDGGGGGDEPCVPAKTVTLADGSGNSGEFGTTGPYCFRTPDNIAGWGCSNLTGRTLKVNNVAKECAAMPLPAKVGGYYYFDVSGGTGAVSWASIYWY